ncbi:MAG: FAD-dependent oxidoreductase [Candidatus Levybacteria bacterium]|nr:FAD-dependent oxidoreductase [Candidatus Levybacteria bacterium]
MKIAIVGAGFTGLSCAYELSKKGFEVTVFEREKSPGGLASGFKIGNWQWPLEKHYHHFFTSDSFGLNLAKELNISIKFFRPKTKSLIDGKIYPLDSPLDVALFNKLSIPQRMRMALVLAYLKLTPFWKSMEKVTAVSMLPKLMGEKPYKLIWEPLLKGKFGKYKNEIALSWFWARIKKRSQRLGYPLDGYQTFADKIKDNIEKLGGLFYFETQVKEIIKENGKIKLICGGSDHQAKEKTFLFDAVIATVGSLYFTNMVKNLPKDYVGKLNSLQALSSLTLVLVLKTSFLNDGTYWLNICGKDFPFLSVVEHTNFIDKKHYDNEHLVYVGNYLPADHPFMKMNTAELLKIYKPWLRKINPYFQLSILNSQLFKAPFAQPVIPLNYSKSIPSFKTPIKNIYLANMQQVYPWDRGANYAIELGQKAAKTITNIHPK